ncbi:YheC/YheD family protein [Paenibacillus tarimensis]
MARYKSYSIKNKWIKTKWLNKDEKLKKFVPKTRLFNKIELIKMVEQYRMFYFKPTSGTGGQNISRVIRLNNRTFQIQKGSSKITVNSISSLYEKLKKSAKGKSYLLQQGIYLKSSNKRPFDLRVMMQKTKKRKWIATAIFSKIGKANKVVTNYHQGGRLSNLEDTLRGARYSKTRIAHTRNKLIRMGIDTGKCFDRHNKGFRELGLDVAIDNKGRSWILEVNTRPQFHPLKNMRNKALYRRIVRFGKQYGRF